MTSQRQRHPTEADRAFSEAIDSAIDGHTLYPNGSVFIDAEVPGAGRAIAEAAGEGRAIVVCTEGGGRFLLQASEVDARSAGSPAGDR